MTTVLTFRLHEELFGLDILHVKEIQRNVEFTPVPGASAHIVGIFNMRGQIVTLFDLSGILGYTPMIPEGKKACIILKTTIHHPDLIGFLIHKTGDVIDILPEQCETPPGNIEEICLQYLKSVARIKEEVVMMIEPSKMNSIFHGYWED